MKTHGLIRAFTLATLAAIACTPPTPARAAYQSLGIEDLLQQQIHLSADHVPLKTLFSKLAESGAQPINLVVNWPALAEAGIPRDLPLSAQLHDVTLEDAIRAVITAAGAGKLNYAVSIGVVEITTNAEIGKHAETRFYDLSAPLRNTFAPVPGEMAWRDDQAFLREFLLAQLRCIGERTDGPNRDLTVKDNVLAATTSPRGHTAIRRALDLLANPVHPGQYPPGTAISVAARNADQSLKKLLADPATSSLTTLATNPSTPTVAQANLNILLLPGTDDELHKPTPALASWINSAGILFIGPAATTHEPNLLAVFDTRDLLKRAAAHSGTKPPPPPASFAVAAITHVKSRVKSVIWGDWGKAETTLAPYHGLLIVFVPAAAQRDVSAALQDFAR
ncbi:MAG TPA: hypothetical protein VM008_18325 [Phycisphaerae bacterium]|nr:hypothetical protein [Phycisphaerae bacterium]